MMSGKDKKDDKRILRQSTLDKVMEKGEKVKEKDKGEKENEKDKGKKVSFIDDEKRKEFDEWKKRLIEELRAVRSERVEVEIVRKGLIEKEMTLSEMISKFEKKLENLDERVKVIERREECRMGAAASGGRARQAEGIRQTTARRVKAERRAGTAVGAVEAVGAVGVSEARLAQRVFRKQRYLK